MPTVVARLEAADRDAFKEPLGEIYEDAEDLLRAAGDPVVAIGDVVLAHLGAAGQTPALAVVDGRTEREPIDDWVREGRPEAATVRDVENPAGTITAALVRAIEAGLAAPGPTRIDVDGEEDLAVLPAILLAPAGSTVVYGQPDEGMVAVPVDASTRSTGRRLLGLLDRDREFWERVE